jgi:hypothetical protein
MRLSAHDRPLMRPFAGVVIMACAVVVAANVLPRIRLTSAPVQVSVCGTQFCAGGTPWYPYGASIYQATSLSGIDYPTQTIALAQEAKLNTLRVVNFYDTSNGDPSATPFDPTVWAKVDAMIAAAGSAGMHVYLDLADYRGILWKHCINPYTSDWSTFLHFVATRKNTVTGATYDSDPNIVFVSFAGDPLPVGAQTFTDSQGSSCTLTYTTQDLTNFYASVEGLWKSYAPSQLTMPGGLGYLNESGAGIDWKTIFANPNNDICGMKTYGGMFAYSLTVAQYCTTTLHKPIVNVEWGYQQGVGDAARASEFRAQFNNDSALGASGNFFWNIGYQTKSTGYDVGTQTPLTLAVVQQNSPVTGSMPSPTPSASATPTPTPAATPTPAPTQTPTPTATPGPTPTPKAAPSPSPTPGPGSCPAGWSCADIGTPVVAGGQTVDNGTWTVWGGGRDIFGTSDQFHYVWQSLTGDGGIAATIVSQADTSSWAKAGVMLRSSTDANSPYYAAYVTPGNVIAVQYRGHDGGGATDAVKVTGGAPVGLEVLRVGDTYTAYISTDGVTWTALSQSTETLQLGTTVLSGLAVTSHHAASSCSVEFTGVMATA